MEPQTPEVSKLTPEQRYNEITKRLNNEPMPAESVQELVREANQLSMQTHSGDDNLDTIIYGNYKLGLDAAITKSGGRDTELRLPVISALSAGLQLYESRMVDQAMAKPASSMPQSSTT
jgi:hypothetical protein